MVPWEPSESKLIKQWAKTPDEEVCTWGKAWWLKTSYFLSLMSNNTTPAMHWDSTDLYAGFLHNQKHYPGGSGSQTIPAHIQEAAFQFSFQSFLCQCLLFLLFQLRYGRSVAPEFKMTWLVFKETLVNELLTARHCQWCLRSGASMLLSQIVMVCMLQAHTECIASAKHPSSPHRGDGNSQCQMLSYLFLQKFYRQYTYAHWCTGWGLWPMTHVESIIWPHPTPISYAVCSLR